MQKISSLLSRRSTIQIILATFVFLSATIIADRYFRSVRLDLTAENLYTLSDGTKELLRSVDEPITLDFYFSKTQATPFPQLLSYGKRIEDLLRAFAAENADNIQLSIIDPEPFSEEEDEAVGLGLRGVPLNDGSTLYIGLAAADAVDGEAVIPFFSEEREKFLEYDLVKLLATLDTSDRRKLKLLTTLPMQFGPGGPQAMLAGQSEPYVLYEQLFDFFDVEDLAEGFTEIPTDTDVLMLVHPPALSEDQMFAIDQYVLKGGKALVFLDPHAEAVDPRAVVPSSSSLDPLLASWGVEMPAGQVVGDASLAQRVQMGGFGPDSVKDYVFWLAITDDFLSDTDVVTGAVSSMNFASAGVLKPLADASTSITPLVTTSTVSSLFPAERAVGVPDPDAVLRDMAPDEESYILSARIEGLASTAFPDRVAQAVIAAGSDTQNAPVASGQINVAVTSDADLFDDRFWVQLQDMLGQRVAVPLAGNGSFVLNLADHISGSDALLGLRGRGISKRPFEKVDALRREAESKYLSEEEELQNRLSETEARIASLESQNPEGAAVLSAEQELEIESFRDQLLETRKALRNVNRNLRRNIENLGDMLAFINIALMPMLIILYVLVRLVIRRRAGGHRFL
ncbi:GldG family protein [Kordiimonas aquimaris]|uniref:GldG family protein n=1 Tax=Kordiimonas aquimaris TaxID=707591 RepID=UPI0021CDED66|nr:Gldg family protein [Kordiimonas aquimaris]